MSIFKRMAGIGILAILFVASTAVADITVGQSDTSLSNDVAYTLVTLDKPSGSGPDDVLVASISLNGGSAGAITPPNGWTLIARADNDPNVSIASYYKIVGASEPSSYTWTINPQTRAVGGVTRYSGINIASPIDTVATAVGRSPTATAPSITTTSAGDRVLALFTTNTGNSSTIFATSSGMTKRYDIKNSPFGPTSASEDVLQATIGTVNAITSSFSNSPRDWAAQTVALRQASGLTNSLVGYWKLDEVSGIAHSSFGTPATLFNSGGASYGSGIINNGLVTDGTNKYLSADGTGSNMVLSNTDFSVNAWVNIAASTPFAVSMYGNSGGTRNWIFSGVNGLTLDLSDSTGTIEYISTVPWSPSFSVWYMVSVTYSKSTGAVNFYVNGVQQGATQITTTNLPNGFVGPFSIGTWDPINNGGLFNGTTDEVGVWNRELSASEIVSLYNGGNGISYPF